MKQGAFCTMVMKDHNLVQVIVLYLAEGCNLDFPTLNHQQTNKTPQLEIPTQEHGMVNLSLWTVNKVAPLSFKWLSLYIQVFAMGSINI